MIMSRKLARRRMLMWDQLQNDSVIATKIYVFVEGETQLRSGVASGFKYSFTDGMITLKPIYQTNADKWGNADIDIGGIDLSKYNTLYVEGYYAPNENIAHSNNSALVGYGSSSSFIKEQSLSTQRSTYSFTLSDLPEATEEHYIKIVYNRADNNVDFSNLLYICNIWLEGTSDGSGGSGETEDPETPTPQTFSVSITGENFTFEGNTGENAATENADYTASITAADGYEIESVTVAVDGNQIGSFTFINGDLTISGEDVTGDIVINVATIEEIVEPEGPEESTLWIYEYGKDSLSNGELIDNPYYSNIIKQGITYNYDGGYLFVHKNTLASGADNIPSMIIGGINLVDYDKIYIEYICKLGSTVSPTHPEDHLYIGYGKTTSINSTAFTDYVSEWNILNEQRAEFDISGITDSSIQYYIKAVFRINLSAENTGIKIKNIWLEKSSTESGGTDGGDSGDTEPTYYNVTTNLANASITPDIEQVETGTSYSATITANNGYELSSVSIMMGEENVTAFYYADGVITIDEVIGDIVITAVAEPAQSTKERIYLFDSSRSDNFIFGEYRYSDDSGVIMIDASKSWPPANSDGINTSSNCIILSGGNGGTMDLGEPTFLYLEDNSSGLSVEGGSGISAEGMLCNNVSIILGGKAYEPRKAAIPFDTYTLKVKGYKTGTKSDGFVDYGNGTFGYDKLILINSTSEQTYEAEIEIVKNGRFQFASTSGSGDVVITDIWLEEIE